MKRFISLILTLTIILSVATVVTGAATTNVAETSATYYVSNEPYENVANANIIGYIGDVDVDKSISIMDATQVQLTLASIIALDSTAKLLADANRDGDISIMDATDIQCFIAQIDTGAKVAHTLYEKKATTDTTVYEQIVDFMKKNASYSSQLGMYRLRKDTSNSPNYMTICYYESNGTITITYHTGESSDIENEITITVTPDDKNATYNASTVMQGSKYFSAFGEIVLIDADKKKVDFTEILFSSDMNITFNSAKTSINSQLSFAFMYLKGVMQDNLNGNLYTLF